MKKLFFTYSLIALAGAGLLTATAAAAHESEVALKEQPRNVYHAVHEQSLSDAARRIADRSGIRFKFPGELGNDRLTVNLAADDWKSAVAQLLSGYNYTLESDGGKLKTVIITGRNGSGLTANANLQSIAPEQLKLPGKYRHFPAGSVMPLSLPVSQMTAVGKGRQIMMDLPIGKYSVHHDELIDDGNGATTWAGFLENEGKGYRVTMSKGEAGIMGHISTPDGIYEIESEGNQTFLIDLARAGLRDGGFHNDGATIQSGLRSSGLPNAGLIAAASQELTGGASSSLIQSRTVARTTAPISNIDVMVLYTKVNQTATYAKQRIQYLVNLTNIAYRDSLINMRLRLVHTRATTYVERGANSTALGDLAASRGALSNVAALRNQYGADIVLLFRPYYASTSGNCGTAYIGFANGSGANSSSGFGVISDGKSREAPTAYYCGVQTLAHEVGHNLGNVHDRTYTSLVGKFPYSYAWGIANKFGTIMSYFGPGLMLFATPALNTQCAGLPCGYPAGHAKSSDQRSTINYTAPFVKNYRPTTIVTPVIQ